MKKGWHRCHTLALSAVALWLISFFIYMVAPLGYPGDSLYTMLSAYSLTDQGTIELSKYGLTRAPVDEASCENIKIEDLKRVCLSGLPYHLDAVDNRITTYFPAFPSLLSIPFVIAFEQFDTPVFQNHKHHIANEVFIQRVAAAVITAFVVIALFFAAVEVLGIKNSVLCALAISFGSPLLSILSRSVWSDTWGVLFSSIAFWIIIRADERKIPPNPVLLAVALSLSFFCKPSYALSIILVSFYILIYHKNIIWRYIITGIICLAIFLISSKIMVGQWLPKYYLASRLGNPNFINGLLGALFSPSRGLFVFLPALIPTMAFLIMNKKTQLPRPVVLAFTIIVSNLIVVASYWKWWGGWSYGPRLLASLIPLFFLLYIYCIRGIVEGWNSNRDRSPIYYRSQYALILLLFLLSGVIHYRGAFCIETSIWNGRPENVDIAEKRLWDVKGSQIMAGLIGPKYRDMNSRLSRLLTIDTASNNDACLLLDGWGEIESRFRWSIGKRSLVLFKSVPEKDIHFSFEASPFLAKGKLEKQVATVYLNERRVASVQIKRPSWHTYTVVFPWHLVKQVNVVTLEHTRFGSPKSWGVNDDARELAVAYKSFSFDMELE